MDDWKTLLGRTAELAEGWLEGLPDRRVAPAASPDELRAAFDPVLSARGEPPLEVIENLARAAGPGLVAQPGPRYFGFVIGGSLPATVAADWLTSAWDQNAGLFIMSPAAAIIEETAARWVKDLAGLPAGAGVGFATGATMATFTCLAAARSAVLHRADWDVEERGLIGAPPVRVIVGAEIHVTATYALRLLGFGSAPLLHVPVDDDGRMRVDALAALLGGSSEPTIVCAQAGNVNTGAFDPLDEIATLTRNAGAWLHVDGAFGFWAAVSPALRHLTRGMERADSWTTDAHKWLNVPYDCGIAIVAEPKWQLKAMAISAAYLTAADVERDGYDWVPEGSRRARGVTVYAALRSLGRQGLAELIERTCALARRFGERLHGEPGIRILNEIILNQVLVRFDAADGDVARGDARTRATIAGIQADGTMWAGSTTWHGRLAMRISVSNWSTTEADVDASVEAILRAARENPG